MELGLAGKRALLLASSGGLGYASALALAQEGVQVCVSGSDAARAASAAKRISDQTGQPAFGLSGDLSDPANMGPLVDAAESSLGGRSISCSPIMAARRSGPRSKSVRKTSPTR